MNELALFAGAGGGILGGKLLGWRTIGAVEISAYCRGVLLRRQQDGMLPLFPIWDNIKTFRSDNKETSSYIKAARSLASLVITAGFPCQPYSTAGRRRGADDSRNLWPDTIRVIREVEPEVALLENVSGLLSFDYYGEIIGQLAESGYDTTWQVISASSLGLPHIRKRLWILAWKNEKAVTLEGDQSFDFDRCCSKLNGWWYDDPANIFSNVKNNKLSRDTNNERTSRRIKQQASLVSVEKARARREWGIKSKLGRVADGVANRLDRFEVIGNGQVAILAAFAFVSLAMRVKLDLRRYCPTLFPKQLNNEREVL